MAKKVTFMNVRPEGFEFPVGLNSKLVNTDTRVNVGQQLATSAPSGLTSPTSPEGQQNYIGPDTPGPGQKVNHIFRQSGSFTAGFTGNVDVIIVGGGGAGGGGYGGGGGGGGVIWASSVTVHSGQSYPIIIGAGGTNPAHNPPQNGGQGSNTEMVFYDGAHPMCNSTGYLLAYGGGGGGAVGRSGQNGNPVAQSGEGTAPGNGYTGSGGGGAGVGANYIEECIGAIGKQDPNYADYYPVDGGQLEPLHPTITGPAIVNNPVTSPLPGPPTNPTGHRISFAPFYPYPGMNPPMPAPQYTSGGRGGLGANNQYGMPGGWGSTSGYYRDSALPSTYPAGAPYPGSGPQTAGGPVQTGGGGGGAFGQGLGYGRNPPSPYPTGTPLWGFGGDDFRATVKGVVPVASLGAGGSGGTNGPPRGGGSGAGGGASSGRNPISAPPSFPGQDRYYSATSGQANLGGGGGGGGAPGTYNPFFANEPGPSYNPAYVEAPGSGGSGVVYVIYDAITGETSNGAVYFIN